MSRYIVVLPSEGIKLLTVLIHKHNEKCTLYYNEVRWLLRNWRQSDIWVRYHWELRDNNFVYGPDWTNKNLVFFLSWQENLYWSIPFVTVLKSILRIVEDPKPNSRVETWCWHPSSAQLCPTLCDPMGCSTPGFPVHHQLPEFTQTHVHRVGDAIQPSHPLSFPSPAFNLSQHQGVFQWVSSSVLHIRWPKYWSFSFSINPSSEYSGLISSRMDWLDLFAVQGTLKSLLQHHSSKASVLQCSAIFMVQVSYPYMITQKNHSFDWVDLCW